MMSLRVVKSSFFVFVGLVISLQLFACGNPHPPKKKPTTTVAAAEPNDLSANADLVKKPGASPSASPSPSSTPSVVPSVKPSATPSMKPSASPSPAASIKPAAPAPMPSVSVENQWFQPLQMPAAPAALKFEDKLGLCPTLQPSLAPADATQLKEIFDGSAGTYILSDVQVQQGLKAADGKWHSLTQGGSANKPVVFKEVCKDYNLEKGKIIDSQGLLPRTINRQTGVVGASLSFLVKMGAAAKEAMKASEAPAPTDAKKQPLKLTEVAVQSREAGWQFYVTPLTPKRSFEVYMRQFDEKTGKLFTVQATYIMSL